MAPNLLHVSQGQGTMLVLSQMESSLKWLSIQRRKWDGALRTITQGPKKEGPWEMQGGDKSYEKS